MCSSGSRPAEACWAARSDVGGPQNAASGGGVGRAVQHARRMQQQQGASPPAGARLNLLAHRGGTTASATAVLDHPNLGRRHAKPRRRAACEWCVKLALKIIRRRRVQHTTFSMQANGTRLPAR